MDGHKKDILLIANYWHFEEEKASSRYRSFADILCRYYDLEVVTSTFCHLKKQQRDPETLNLSALPYRMTLQYEKGCLLYTSLSLPGGVEKIPMLLEYPLRPVEKVFPYKCQFRPGDNGPVFLGAVAAAAGEEVLHFLLAIDYLRCV